MIPHLDVFHKYQPFVCNLKNQRYLFTGWIYVKVTKLWIGGNNMRYNIIKVGTIQTFPFDCACIFGKKLILCKFLKIEESSSHFRCCRVQASKVEQHKSHSAK